MDMVIITPDASELEKLSRNELIAIATVLLKQLSIEQIKFIMAE